MRYRLLAPVPGGYAFWAIADTQSAIMPNFAVVTISKHCPGAESLARLVLEKLGAA